MVAFKIFYGDRKGNENLNLVGRVQEAYSTTEGFSSGEHVWLPASASSLLTHGRTHGRCPGCSKCTCLYSFPANHPARKDAPYWSAERTATIPYRFRGSISRGAESAQKNWLWFWKLSESKQQVIILYWPKNRDFAKLVIFKPVISKSYIFMSTVEPPWVLHVLNYVRITTNSVINVILSFGPRKAPRAFSLQKKTLVIETKLVSKEQRSPGGRTF